MRCTDTRPFMFNWLVSHAKFAEIMSNHLGLEKKQWLHNLTITSATELTSVVNNTRFFAAR